MDPQPHEFEVEVFRTGDYGAKGTYGESDLDAIASAYNPSAHEAPVTLDHDQRGPALGWVKRLRRYGDRLLATLARISPRLVEALRAGAYRKSSIELYRAFGDGKQPYLKAVSFLGAAAPEVRGLAPPMFSEGAGDVVRFDHETDAATAGEAVAEVANTDATNAAHATRKRLSDAKRWVPAWEDLGLLDVFEALAGRPELEQLVAVFESLPAAVSFGEAASARPTANFAESLAGAAPTPDSIERHRAALQLLELNPDRGYASALLEASRRL